MISFQNNLRHYVKKVLLVRTEKLRINQRLKYFQFEKKCYSFGRGNGGKRKVMWKLKVRPNFIKYLEINGLYNLVVSQACQPPQKTDL